MSQGLTSAEAQALLSTHGRNELPGSRPSTLLGTILKSLAEPMVLLLIGCVTVYFLLGDIGEALFLAISIGIVIALSTAQQRKADRAIEALRDISSPRALVVRDGRQIRISGTDVVPGDLVLLQEGDRVPADGNVIAANHIYCDESLLTGEADPVRKKLGDRVLSGTMIVKGHGSAVISQTGHSTEIGRIGKLIVPNRPSTTRLQSEIRRIVLVFGTLGILFCIAIAVTYGIRRDDWLNGALAGLSAAMSLLPEEFPMVLTIFLALGAWRLSKINVLTRNLSAIENLGAITALCVDKTGTLTMNKMTVKALASQDEIYNLMDRSELPEKFHKILEFGTLASHRNPYDPMEKAIAEALVGYLSGTEHIHENWTLVEEYPLSDELLAMSCVWKSSSLPHYVVAAKGAPEAMLSLSRLDENSAAKVRQQATQMAESGLRVLGVAMAIQLGNPLPHSQQEFRFSFLGLLGLEDPIRPDAKEAVKTCLRAGIKVYMITGDYAGTALKIASDAGLESANGAIHGSDLSKISDEELGHKLEQVRIFARTLPEQKLKIVDALKKNKNSVAMTGDGVNDAPSLKHADVGIAMGGRGTDVARESADLILLDDQFGSIVNGIARGRQIYSNIRRAMAYLFAVHVPIAGLSIFPILKDWPLLLFPIHIAFLELIIDPGCTMAFEGRESGEDTMRMRPRPPNEPIFSFRDIVISSSTGLISFLCLLAPLVFQPRFFDSFEDLRTISFLSLVIVNLGLIWIFMGGAAGQRLWIIFALITVATVGLWAFPFTQKLLSLSAPNISILAFALSNSVVALTVAAVWYYLVYLKTRPNSTLRTTWAK